MIRTALNSIKKNLPTFFPIATVTAVLGSLIIKLNFYSNSAQHFTELAKSFLHHHLYFLENSVYTQLIGDTVLFNNHYYWPLGPLPAVILIPFVWIGELFKFYFYQGYLNLFLVILIYFAIYKISRKFNYTIKDSLYWSTAFVFSSMFLGVAAIGYSWYFAQTITVYLLFLALCEYFEKKRYYLIGLFLGLILLTRVTAFFCILFFISDIILSSESIDKKIKNFSKLLIAPIICLGLLLLYNYFRFQSPFDQGYFYQILSLDNTLDKRNFGLFNIRYLPRGLYYSLFNMPMPVYSSETHFLTFPFIKKDIFGMSIFVTSPYLLYLLFLKNINKKIWLLLGTSILVWLFIICSFFSGSNQFGFRYALDFFPLLFVAFMMAYKNEKSEIGWILKIFIILSAFLNFYLLLAK